MRALPVLNDCVPSCDCSTRNIDALIVAAIGGHISGFTVFDTIPDLRANEVYWDKGAFRASGDAVKDDGGGHDYTFRADSYAVDNGASVLKPDNINAADPGRYVEYL